MPAQPTTKTQVNGYRFLVRRMEHALIRRDVRMLHDPMRSQSRSITVGLVLGVLGLAGCALLALFRPQDKIGDARIVVGKESGSLYVSVGETLNPVLNLASARLIAGEAVKPVVVKESEIGSRPRGPLVGIPGAPSTLPDSGDQIGPEWTVCDSISGGQVGTVTTTVIAGDIDLSRAARQTEKSEAMLITGGGKTYLAHEGKRAQVDLNDLSVVRALNLGDVKPRPVSAGLLNALLEVRPIAPPVIPRPGEQPRYPVGAARIGSVVEAELAGTTQQYVVLENGIQRVGQTAADIIRAADPQGMAELSKVAPGVLSRVPSVNDLPVEHFPEVAPDIISAGDQPVSCLSWVGGTGQDNTGRSLATIRLITGRELPLPSGATAVPLAGADGPGNRLDAAYLPPGRAGFVQATGIEAGSRRAGQLFLIADTGVRFGVADAETATVLGLGTGPVPAPWPIVELLAQGPLLSRADALVTHDGMTADPEPGMLKLPEQTGRPDQAGGS